MYKPGRHVTLVVLLAVAGTGLAQASDLAQQIADFESGEVRFEFASRDGVFGDGGSIIVVDGSLTRIHGTHYISCDDDENDWREDCEEGPVRISMRVRDGRVNKIRYWVAGQWRRARGDVLDLGEVEPQAAADYLLRLTREARRSVAEDCILPATLARDVVVWPELLEIARDRQLDDEVRSSAVFWLGQQVGDKVTAGLAALVDDDDEELQLREAAIFALHNRDSGRRFDALSRIALESRHPQLRRSALFWLAESESPRVLDLFEEILTSR